MKTLAELLDDLVKESENARFHSVADAMGEDEEDCCDDGGFHLVRASEIRSEILSRFDR